VVTTSCAYFHFARETAGALGARHSPRPLWAERLLTTRTRQRRGRAEGCLPRYLKFTPLSSRTSERIASDDPGPITTIIEGKRKSGTASLNTNSGGYGSLRRRDDTDVFARSDSDEAIHTFLFARWIASLALAMTAKWIRPSPSSLRTQGPIPQLVEVKETREEHFSPRTLAAIAMNALRSRGGSCFRRNDTGCCCGE
jgi:hypothetical protein